MNPQEASNYRLPNEAMFLLNKIIEQIQLLNESMKNNKAIIELIREKQISMEIESQDYLVEIQKIRETFYKNDSHKTTRTPLTLEYIIETIHKVNEVQQLTFLQFGEALKAE